LIQLISGWKIVVFGGAARLRGTAGERSAQAPLSFTCVCGPKYAAALWLSTWLQVTWNVSAVSAKPQASAA
jgi:hypothetical protein